MPNQPNSEWPTRQTLTEFLAKYVIIMEPPERLPSRPDGLDLEAVDRMMQYAGLGDFL